MEAFDLIKMFSEWNLRHFGGELPAPVIRWNSRLRSSAGRFTPSYEKPVIEVATYLCEEDNAEHLIRDTIGHELIHYYLWVKRKPYGHTPEFHQIMKDLGVSRYNPVPRHRPFKHCYECKSCEQRIFVRKRMRTAACAACCNTHSNGQYNAQYKLKLIASGEEVRSLKPSPKRVG